MEQTIISHSPEETQKVAANIAASLPNGTTICLYGELAAGKTTFSQGIAKHFGINRLVSPTFIIMRQYDIQNHPTISTLCHLDLYRISHPEEIKAFNFDELTSDKSNLVLVEWPEKFIDLLPLVRTDIYLTELPNDGREIRIVTRQ